MAAAVLKIRWFINMHNAASVKEEWNKLPTRNRHKTTNAECEVLAFAYSCATSFLVFATLLKVGRPWCRVNVLPWRALSVDSRTAALVIVQRFYLY